MGRGQHAGVTASNDIILVIMPQRSGGCAEKSTGRAAYKIEIAIRIRGNVYHEVLCVVFLPNAEVDSFPASRYKRNSVCPARFYWLRPNFRLKRACIARRGNSLESLRLNAYDFCGQRKFLLVHRVLGVTFCCPPTLWSLRFTREVEIDHVFEDHGDNRVSRLDCKRKNDHRAQPKRRALTHV